MRITIRCIAVLLAACVIALCQSSSTRSDQRVKAPEKAELGTIIVGNSERQAIKVVKPVYPELAKKARVRGNVLLDIVIGKRGSVEAVSTISGQPMLVQAAIDAVKQWTWEPILLNGKPIRFETTVTVSFELN